MLEPRFPLRTRLGHARAHQGTTRSNCSVTRTLKTSFCIERSLPAATLTLVDGSQLDRSSQSYIHSVTVRIKPDVCSRQALNSGDVMDGAKRGRTICAVVAVCLTACGGGSSPPTPNADPQGFWQGTAGDGRDVSSLILEQGQYFMVFSSGTTVSGMVEGAFSVSGNTLIDNAAIDFPASGAATTASVTGSVTTRQSLSLTDAESSGVRAVTGTYSPAYDTPVDISEAIGTWVGNIGSTGETRLTISPDLSFTGTQGSCSFSGSVRARPTGKHVFDGSLTFNDVSCASGTGTSMNVEAVVSGTKITAVGVNSWTTVGFAFVGARQ